jgi:hypothetical protein
MRKAQLVFLPLIVSSINFSCLKKTGNSNSTVSSSDVVTGTYLAMNVPPGNVSGSATVSKTGSGKYQFTPGSASIPRFSFEYDAFGSFFTGSNFAYLIPKQNSNGMLLDTAHLILYTYGAKLISFTLTSRATGTSWRYDGVKQ